MVVEAWICDDLVYFHCVGEQNCDNASFGQPSCNGEVGALEDTHNSYPNQSPCVYSIGMECNGCACFTMNCPGGSSLKRCVDNGMTVCKTHQDHVTDSAVHAPYRDRQHSGGLRAVYDGS